MAQEPCGACLASDVVYQILDLVHYLIELKHMYSKCPVI